MIIIYTLYMLAVLAAEESMYKSESGTLTVEIIELVFMMLFMVEVTLYLISFGPIYFFKFYYNIPFILIAFITIIWLLLEIIDSDIFRVKGAFRILRVLMIILRLNDLRYLTEVRITKSSKQNDYHIQSQIYQLLKQVHDSLKDPNLKSVISY